MLKNYFKIAFRNLLNNKVYSTLNIVGLTVGLATCLIVATVVIDDLSYDKQWTNAENIYRVITVSNNQSGGDTRFPQAFSGMGSSLVKTFPEVNNSVRASVSQQRVRLGKNDDGIELDALITEPSVWKVFNFNVTQGNPVAFIKGYTNLVITERFREQYFPRVDPIGKLVKNIPVSGMPQEYLITGVIKEIPGNTHLRAEVLLISEFSSFGDKELLKEENGTFYQQYVLLRPGTSIKAFVQKLNKWYIDYITQSRKESYSYQLQPLADVHLKSDFDSSNLNNGSIKSVYLFSGISVLLLLIACINFVNLTTARALKRMREVGIRKVLGSGPNALIAQFLFESLIFFCISFIFGLILYTLFLESVETYIGHALTLTVTGNLTLFASTFIVILVVSLFTGFYPAWRLSRTNLVTVMKGSTSAKSDSDILRKGLIVGQFVISTVIMVSGLIIHNQLQFFNEKEIGYDKNNLLVLDWNAWGTQGGAFKQELLKLTAVKYVSVAAWAPGSGGGSMSMEVDDPNQKGSKLKVWYIAGDIDLAKTLDLKLLSGRMLDKQLSTDAINFDSLISKDFTKLEVLQKQQPTLMTAYTASLLNINLLEKNPNIQGVPVGIIKDFNNESLKTGLKPCFIKAQSNMMYGSMLIRVEPGSEKQILTSVNSIWKKFYSEKVLQFKWADDIVADQYRSEHKLQQLFTFFSLLMVFLACMGLFGLVSFTTEQRTKEMGIRKVLGASIADIMSLVSGDFIKLVLFAFVIASPIAWYLMNLWLQDYSYRIEIEGWMFAVVGILSVTIALATISFQTIKSAIANPVKSLKNE